MTFRTRKNLLYGVVALIVALATLTRLLDVFPAYIDDVIARSSPVLLVVLGLSVLLRNRVPLSGLISVLAGVALVMGISTAAFSIRAAQTRDDLREVFTEQVSPDVLLLRVRLQALETDVEIVRTTADADVALIRARFTGSTESQLTQNYLETEDGTATFNFDELRPNPLPILSAVGRGTLLVEIPPDVPVDLQVQLSDGALRLNLNDVALERLNIDHRAGDAIITLPEYSPQYSRPEETLGAWAVVTGSLTVRVPESVSARFDMSDSTGGDPTYDPNVYNLLFGRDILEARNIDTATIIMRYDLAVTRDRLTVDIPD